MPTPIAAAGQGMAVEHANRIETLLDGMLVTKLRLLNEDQAIYEYKRLIDILYDELDSQMLDKERIKYNELMQKVNKTKGVFVTEHNGQRTVRRANDYFTHEQSLRELERHLRNVMERLDLGLGKKQINVG